VQADREVLNFVGPESRVNLVCTYWTEVEKQAAVTFLRNVEVLAVKKRDGNTAVLILALTAVDRERLAAARYTGGVITMTLRSTRSEADEVDETTEIVAPQRKKP
jgi:hypothetical protein